MEHKNVFLKTLCIFIFLFFSLNRIVAGFLYLTGFTGSNFNSPFFSPFGIIGTLGFSPLPRAYAGLGFSDKIEVFIKTENNDYMIDLNFSAIDAQAQGHLYKYDVLLHSLFWPIKAPEIEGNASKILNYIICLDSDFLKINDINDKPVEALVTRLNIVTGAVVWTKVIICKN